MKKIVFIVVWILFSMDGNAQQDDRQIHHDKPATHGMLLFGDALIYASHLPMFHTPHDYQIILELTLSGVDKQKYIDDKKQHSNAPTYTIEPERFILPDMVNHPKTFKANIYRGHFERGGIAILKDISVTIKQVIYFKKFNSDEMRMTTTNYIFFGNQKEQFLAHQISNKPDFEQIIEVKARLKSFLKDERYTILILNDHSNSPIGVSGNELVIHNSPLQLLRQLYLEFKDLTNCLKIILFYIVKHI